MAEAEVQPGGCPRVWRADTAYLLFDRLTARIVRNAHLDYEYAERVVDQTLAFVATCSTFREEKLGPSDAVDIGWHTFILDTAAYRAFCASSASGDFVHHVPIDDESESCGEVARERLIRTVEAIRRAGFVVDEELWPQAFSTKCSPCHQGCADSP